MKTDKLVSPVSCKYACTQEVIEELKRREQAKEKLQKKKLIQEKADRWGFNPNTIEREIWPSKKKLIFSAKLSPTDKAAIREQTSEKKWPQCRECHKEDVRAYDLYGDGSPSEFSGFPNYDGLCETCDGKKRDKQKEEEKEREEKQTKKEEKVKEKVEKLKESMEYLGDHRGDYSFLLEKHGVYKLILLIDKLNGSRSWGVLEGKVRITCERSKSEARRVYELICGLRSQAKSDIKAEREGTHSIIIMHKIVDAGYRQLSKERHPDKGGSHEHMAALNNAKDKLLLIIDQSDFATVLLTG